MDKSCSEVLIEMIENNRFDVKDLLITLINWLEEDEVENFVDDEELFLTNEEEEEEDV